MLFRPGRLRYNTLIYRQLSAIRIYAACFEQLGPERARLFMPGFR